MEKERKVIHLHYLPDDSHNYFGSVASMFEIYTPAQLGVAYGTLRNYRLAPDHPYSNSRCVIRKGILVSKEQRK